MAASKSLNVNVEMAAAAFDAFNCVKSPIFVLKVDDNQRPIYAAFNAFACDIAGFAIEDVIGKTAEEIYGGRFGSLAYARHVQTIFGGRPVSYELTLPLRGQERTVRTHLEPVFDDDGDVVFLVGTSADISSEQTLRETRIDAETQMREIENFVKLAAHDLRAPMRQITMLLDMLREGFEDHNDGKIEIIKMLDDVSANAKTLITDLLAHAQATDLEASVSTFSLRELCTIVLVMLDPTAIHDVQVENVRITADETTLQIVLRNLIDNAFRHSGDALKKLSISASPDGGNAIEFSVRDYGTGFQGDAGALLQEGKVRKGVGFGLLGVRRLINAPGGTITARSPEAGPGALVKFSLPGKIEAADSI